MLLEFKLIPFSRFLTEFFSMLRFAGLAVRYILLGIVACAMTFPLVWMLLLSLKVRPQTYSDGSLGALLLAPATLQHYADILAADNFALYFVNSLIAAGTVAVGNVLFCLMCGYAFARREFRGKQLLFASVLGVLIIPPHVVMIPLYRMMVAFGWINSYAALIVPWLVLPFGVFLVRQYVVGLPKDVEDAARMDGAGEWYILFRIVMPLAKPILTVLGVYVFLQQWNAFLFPFLFTNDASHRTLTVALAFYQGKHTIDWAHLMAGASISALPVLVLFVIFQKQIIQGLTDGAVKE
jgi:ABC-type glycerol-3-phosphate transport system permease component